ncbi:type I restriction enzyme HsdR N-terminal domain-containing protein [Chitinophaga pendula]|uniref:type I restriction endonuclease n=1 Tax=Chitinophaga TaxID=79328 RepID=UPI000BB0413A|nr:MULTISPECIES: type I restriction endonuclease [Chitinophaga]ASZ11414.1 restriction endonuclease [Chitinophaga sp. MD30]UCJ05582.1 type I restriction enzyme HsdR N-terminal domain-containing protein [Chitinophaga pendula]
MDFKDTIKQLAERILKHKELVQTEEATKHSFVMPFIQALGYDVFNPMEVVPEFVADLGIKKGEKVDYAIVKEGQPVILIECKHWSSNLDPHNSQLFRYFHTTKAKFSILTNGFESWFYTDLDEPNKMDQKPFFIFDLQDIRDNQIEELKKFHKNYFDSDTIVSTASELKYLGLIKQLFNTEVNNPSPDFVRHFARQVYTNGSVTQKVLDQFTQFTKKAFQIYISDLITERLKSALQKEENDQPPAEAVELIMEPESKIQTTQEELDSFQIIRSILRQVVPVDKIHYRDAQSYFAILYDDNNRKPLCRLYIGATKKQIGLFGADRTEVKKELSSLDDIFQHADHLLETAKSYLKTLEV